jgi:voltage-dependent calcium channel alpha-2/delta-3
VLSGVFQNDSQVDMFDCRTRLWYIDASLSPKDVIILVDNSGSMTGASHDTARHVVNSILETLGSNDFFNVLMFNNTVAPVISCLHNDTLIQVRAQCSRTTMITKMKLYYSLLFIHLMQN